MKNIGTVVAYVVALAIVVGALGAFVWLVKVAFDSISSRGLTTIFAVAAAPAGILGGAYVTNLLSQRRDVQKHLRVQKIPIYERFMDFWMETLGSTASDTGLDRAKTEEFFRDFSTDVIVWGSDRFVQQYGAYRILDFNAPDAGMANMAALEDLFFEIRRDLGHANRDLERGHILRLFINDIQGRVSEMPKRPR